MALNSLGLGFTVSAQDAASAVFQGVGRAMNDMSGKAKEAGISLEQVGTKLDHYGQMMVAAGLAGAAGFAYATSKAAEYGDHIAEISTLVDTAKFSVEDMRKITMGAAQAFGQDLTTETKGLYQAISAGADNATSAQQLMTAANKLAVGGVTDVRTAIDGLTNVLNTYGLAYSHATDVSDAFFVAIKSGKTTAAELGAGVGKLAPTAQAVGIGFDTMLASISAVTTKGLKTDEAITGLKAALANVIKPTSEASAEAARLGIKFDQATLRAKGFPGFLDSITKSSKFNKDSMSKLFGSIEGLNAVLALTSNDSKAFNDILAAMKTRTGETSAAFDKMANSPGFQGALFKSNAEAALVLIGEALTPLATAILRVMNAGVAAFNALPGPVRNAMVFAGLFGSVLLIVLGVSLMVAAAIIALIAAAKVVAVTLAVVTGVGVALAAGLLAIVGVTLALREAFRQNLGGIADYINETVARVHLAYDALTQIFSEGGFSGAVMAELDKAGNEGVKDFAIQLYMLAARVQNFAAGLSEGFGEAMGELGPIFSELKGALQSLGEAFGLVKDGPEAAENSFVTFKSVGVEVGRAVATVFGALVNVFTSVVGAVRAFVVGFTNGGATVDILKSAVMTLINSLTTAWTILGLGVGAASGTGSALQVLAGFLGWMASNVAIFVVTLAGAFSTIAPIVAGMVSNVITILSGLASVLSGIFHVIHGLLTGDFGEAFNGLKSIVAGVATYIIGIVGTILTAVASLIDTVGHMTGQDFGAQKAVATAKADLLVSVHKGLGQEEKGPEPTRTDARPPAPTVPGQASPYTYAKPGDPGYVGPGSPPGATPTQPAAAAASAQAGPSAGALEALLNRPPPPQPPININSQTTLTVDGQVLADIVDKHSTGGKQRGYGGAPTAT